jgi:hypothetical protein
VAPYTSGVSSLIQRLLPEVWTSATVSEKGL